MLMRIIAFGHGPAGRQSTLAKSVQAGGISVSPKPTSQNPIILATHFVPSEVRRRGCHLKG